ncbi:MAG: AI-2E family transporter [Patescibacteria group bacterium]
MNERNVQIGFFLTLLSAAFLATIIMLAPYLSPLLIAGTLALIFRPIHRRITKILGGWEGLATLLTLLLVILLVLTPLTILALKIFEEARNLYISTLTTNGESTFSIINTTIHNFELSLRQFAPNLTLNIRSAFAQLAGILVQNIGSLFSSLIKTLVNLFLMLVTLFYLLKDGTRFRKIIIMASPLPDVHDEEILARLEATVSSVVKGSIFTAIIQGILAGVGFMLFGVPSPFLFGTAAAFAALIPGIGTALVLIPIILILFFSGQTSSAIGLLLWSALIVGLIDNFLGPIIMNRQIKIHPMAVLLAVLGGITLFGPMGILVGPLIVSLLFTLIHIYATLVHRTLD